jgi:hypothetical protein
MDAVELLVKMMWWYGRGLPPRRLGFVVYDWGGFSAAPPGGMHALPTSIDANDVLAHADRGGNVFAAAWLWSKRLWSQPPMALWRLLPTPVPKRRILYFGEWNKMYVSRDGTLAVKWVSAECCTALLWSYPWAWIHSRRVFIVHVPVPAARGGL